MRDKTAREGRQPPQRAAVAAQFRTRTRVADAAASVEVKDRLYDGVQDFPHRRGGGTGGHLYPGIAVAAELRRREPGARVVFAGTPKGLEGRLVPQVSFDLELLPILPLNGVGPKRLLLGLLVPPRGLVQAARLVRRLVPAAVLGVGGYAGGPVCLASAFMGVPTVILEPNATPGFTNRILKPFVRYAALARPETLSSFGRKGVLTGNPVRGGFASLPQRSPASPRTLLAFGGSQGSRILNQALLASIPHLPPATELRVVHQTGPAAFEENVSAWRSAGREGKFSPSSTTWNAEWPRPTSSCRAAAPPPARSCCAAGKPALLIPFAAAADDHQRKNAQAMESEGAAVVLEEAEATGERLALLLKGLVADGERLVTMGRAARRLGRPDAAARVADLLSGEAPLV